MQVKDFLEIIGSDFYVGVPDSQLKALCNYLMDTYGIDPRHHVIAANEGSCTGMAAGYHLATGKIPVVYMQNSGEGNVINPVASLLSDKVYAIPVIFVIGWRGEPGIHDEPQHAFQGEITIDLLKLMDIRPFIVSKETTEDELRSKMEEFSTILSRGKSVAFVVKKGALSYGKKKTYTNDYVLKREDVIRHVVKVSREDPIISTTGKASRELFEIREENGQSHKFDFLTVGSMGHSSSIALEIAINRPDTKIWCLDGDGAVLMHMGAMALIGASAPSNLIHIVINNNAHETVGGMPTVAGSIDLLSIAKACGYSSAVGVTSLEQLDVCLKEAKERDGLSFIEVKSAIGSRPDLGRPTTSAIDNKAHFMSYLQSLK